MEVVVLAISQKHQESKPCLHPCPSDGLAALAMLTALASVHPVLSLLGARTALVQSQSMAAAAAAAAVLLPGHLPAAAELHRAVICNSPPSYLLQACLRRAAPHKCVQHPCREAASAVLLAVRTLQCLPVEPPYLLELGADMPLQEVQATGSPVPCRMWATAS